MLPKIQQISRLFEARLTGLPGFLRLHGAV